MQCLLKLDCEINTFIFECKNIYEINLTFYNCLIKFFGTIYIFSFVLHIDFMNTNKISDYKR
ncbi:MAG: hypothetical protein EAZ53_09930 [Bacteroidetes bacterium]|nr:MAG: hypothetical protein EAZ53_09930 [Bacteroidota bacterium]